MATDTTTISTTPKDINTALGLRDGTLYSFQAIGFHTPAVVIVEQADADAAPVFGATGNVYDDEEFGFIRPVADETVWMYAKSDETTLVVTEAP